MKAYTFGAPDVPVLFADPILHEQDLQHEELLACYPEKWAQLVKSIVH